MIAPVNASAVYVHLLDVVCVNKQAGVCVCVFNVFLKLFAAKIDRLAQ